MRQQLVDLTRTLRRQSSSLGAIVSLHQVAENTLESVPNWGEKSVKTVVQDGMPGRTPNGHM
jgi:hypothetical protein